VGRVLRAVEQHQQHHDDDDDEPQVLASAWKVQLLAVTPMEHRHDDGDKRR
jgi:hypothetical protein